MITLEELQKNWDNLPEAIKIDIQGYVSALLNDTKQVPEDFIPELEKRLESYKKQETAISWGYIYNQMLKELI